MGVKIVRKVDGSIFEASEDYVLQEGEIWTKYEEVNEETSPEKEETVEKVNVGMDMKTKEELGKVLKYALEAEGCFVTISYQDKVKAKGQDDLHHYQFTYKYPTDQLLPALEVIGKLVEKEIN